MKRSLQMHQEKCSKRARTLNPFTNLPYSQNYFSLLQQRRKLPAWTAQAQFLELFNNYPIIVLVGQTGSGKTTQIPQFILDEHPGSIIACTQPRRVAAMSVAQRVADEMDCTLGQQVGYSIRFEDKSSPRTKLKYMTDGMLLRQATKDAKLSQYSVIILDEAHERTLNTDILFGLIKQLSSKRKRLKVIVMSATMEAEKFQKYFNDAPLLNVPGRVFPVQIFYTLQPYPDYLQASIDTVVDLHCNEDHGDILLFLTGEEEIEKACLEIKDRLRDQPSAGPILIVPLYSTLPPHMQNRIFEKAPADEEGRIGRKVVIATNIAQTSLTIDGIVFVVDPGFAKQKVFNPRLMVESLLVSPISKANAKQRAGRAGRTRPGKCFRLYTEDSFNKELEQSTYPEIMRSNLSSLIITLKRLGIFDIVHFDYMDPPSPETLMRAIEQVFNLGAIDSDTNLTAHGQLMAEFPLQPHLSKLLLLSPKYKVQAQILTVVAMLNVPSPFLRPKDKLGQATDAHLKFRTNEGDHLSLLKVFQAYKLNQKDKEWSKKNFLNVRNLKTASDIREQLKRTMLSQGFQFEDQIKLKPDAPSILKCVLQGFFHQVGCLQRNGVYLTVKDSQLVLLHPSCCLSSKPQFVVYNQLVLTKKNYMRVASEVRGEWLFQVKGEYFQPETIKQGDVRRELRKVQERMID